MKIIYTNLQENDSGIKRSVRQLRVDFARDDEQNPSSSRNNLQNDDGGYSYTLNPNSTASSFRRQRELTLEKDVYDNESTKRSTLPALVSQTIRSRQSLSIQSISNMFIRKFIEIQKLTVYGPPVAGIINITV